MAELCKVEMLFDSEKKHSVRYNCDENGAGLASVYLMKSVLPLNNHPEKITVTVETDE